MYKIADFMKEILWNAILHREGKDGLNVCVLPNKDDGLFWIKNENIKEKPSPK